jgi:WD40 repeat protein
VSELSFSPDGRYLAGLAAVAGGTTRAAIFDVRQLKQHGASFGPPAARLAFSPVGMQLAVGAVDGSVSLWNAKTGRLMTSLPLASTEASQPIAALAFNPSGRILATAGWDGRLLLWDTRRRALLREPLDRAARIQDLAFSPDGESFASVGPEGQVKLWDVRTGSAVGALRNEVASLHVRFLDDGHLVTVGNAVLFWDLRSAALSSAACRVAGRNLSQQEWAQLVGGTYRRLCP